MAHKAKIEIEMLDNTRDIVDGYIEGLLFVYKGNAGWECGHVKTGWLISGKKVWKTKKECLAYAQRLIDCELEQKDALLPTKRKLNLEFDKPGDCVKLNGTEFLRKVFEECR